MIEPENRLSVRTTFEGDVIEQLIDIRGSTIRAVIDTRETQVREALIALGWTPPAPKVGAPTGK